ncbi:RIP metalloprotease RseP [Anaerosacchariphilus sp. NSJ-68]|uniref:Zinc metalloprotease n=2 Tax=Lachnospiraceae TaxID=186803 RepID=A0A923LAW2_9FIRM|nr:MULTISPECIES: RIP metalloprotease RseP [Lachnospiraceae]MBC5659134.1 RIP metalloprotease RseP [Anaerosacchariphilus hominis]MBC5696800.1 RIP metalloprotease RseP [Roseburia difficilis]
MKIILALLIFSLIVLFHEFGHFLLAKRGGIAVTEFSLGMGPRILSKQIGETRYSWKLLPFGGSCMMVGEDGDSDDENAFGKKSVWTRISVVAAGPIFNFILAFFLSLFIIGSIGYDAPDVVAVADGYPAAEAGIQPGDRIVQMNHTKIHVYREVSLYVQTHQGETVTVTYERDGERHAVTLEPKLSESGTYLLGFRGSGVRTKGNIFQTVWYSAYEVKYWISTTLQSLGMMFRGRVSADDISGPVGIVNTIGNTYEASKQDGGFYVWLNMLNISILLSANLGVMNLLPIPALDGGRLVFLFLEVIRRGKRIDPEKEGMVHFVGLMLLMALMLVVMFNDFRNIL